MTQERQLYLLRRRDSENKGHYRSVALAITQVLTEAFSKAFTTMALALLLLVLQILLALLLVVRLELVFGEAAQDSSTNGPQEPVTNLMATNCTGKPAGDGTTYATLTIRLWLAVLVVLWPVVSVKPIEEALGLRLTVDYCSPPAHPVEAADIALVHIGSAGVGDTAGRTLAGCSPAGHSLTVAVHARGLDLAAAGSSPTW